jgi:hypothetical protein
MKNGKKLYHPKGRRVRDRFAVSTWEPRSGSKGGSKGVGGST